MLKIALSGAHGTGKSTLISRLKDIRPQEINVCAEAARTVVELLDEPQFFRRKNNTPLRQSLIFSEHLREEIIKSHASSNLLLVDRTLIDHVAYTEVLFPEFTNTAEAKVLKSIAFRSLESYSTIVQLVIEFTAIDDGIRESDAIFQRDIADRIASLYHEAGVVTQSIHGSIDQRIIQLEDLISALTKQA